MDWKLIILPAVLMLIYMSAWFLVGKKRDRLNTVDVAWAGGFVLVAWTVYALHPVPRTLFIAVLVTLWGGRLTKHLYKRVIGGGKEDPRYEAIRSKWKGNVWARAYVSIFLLQGLLVLLISAPIIMAGTTASLDIPSVIYVGAAIWFVGFTIERLADAELAEFLADEKNKGKVMDKGLWRYSRHPNYFGELTQWWGIGVIALQARYGYIGLIGPLTLTILIVFVSGIPMIENRKKSDPAYADYMRRTSRLIPFPPKS